MTGNNPGKLFTLKSQNVAPWDFYLCQVWFNLILIYKNYKQVYLKIEIEVLDDMKILKQFSLPLILMIYNFYKLDHRTCMFVL